MRTRVNVVKIEYHVNDEKQAVTCRMLVDGGILGYFDEFESYRLFIGPLWHKKLDTLDDRFWVTATARVKGNDVFDVNKGKKIARAKASYKAHRKVWLMYREIARVLFQAICKTYTMIGNCTKQCNRELEYVRL